MENLALRMKLSMLWLFAVINLLGNALLMLMESEVIEGIMIGVVGGMEISPAYLFMGAIMVWTPVAMAFLTWILEDQTSRRLNIVLGIVFAVLMCVELVEHAMKPTGYGLLLGVSTVIAPALVAWYSYKWPKKEV